jgi:hypothetical protein
VTAGRAADRIGRDRGKSTGNRPRQPINRSGAEAIGGKSAKIGEREYFLCELQRVRERKNAINDERFHRVQSTIPEPDGEDEELQEVLEVLRREAEFQRKAGQHYEHSGESGGGGVFRRATS